MGKSTIKYFMIFLFIILLCLTFALFCRMNEKQENEDDLSNKNNEQAESVTVSYMRDLLTVPDEIQLFDEGKVISTLTEPLEIELYMEKLYNVLPNSIAEYKSMYQPKSVILKLLYDDTRKVKVVNAEEISKSMLDFSVVAIDNEGLIFLQLENSDELYMCVGKIEPLSDLVS